MIKTFKGKTSDLDVVFRANNNCVDLIRFTIVPRNPVPYESSDGEKKKYIVERDYDNARSFEIYTNATSEGNSDQPNYRNVKVFIDKMEDIFRKGEGKIKCAYKRKVDSTNVAFAFGFGKSNAVHIAVWYEQDLETKNRAMFTFDTVEDALKLIDTLNIFCDEKTQVIIHAIVDSVRDTIKMSIAEQLTSAVEEAVQKIVEQQK